MKSFEIGPGLSCDLERLVVTRLLVQANSGGGKSWLLRRMLEQTAGKIQQLVIDPEGEFSTLREKFDYVLAAKSGGDTAADPRTSTWRAPATSSGLARATGCSCATWRTGSSSRSGPLCALRASPDGFQRVPQCLLDGLSGRIDELTAEVAALRASPRQNGANNMPTNHEIFQPMTNLKLACADCEEVTLLRQHAKSHQRDYASLAAKLDAADREVAALRASQGGREDDPDVPTDKELERILRTLPLDQRIETIIRKYVGGAVSRHYDGETQGNKADARIAAYLLRKMKRWLPASAPSEGVPDTKIPLRAEEHTLSVSTSSPPQPTTGDSSPLAPEEDR